MVFPSTSFSFLMYEVVCVCDIDVFTLPVDTSLVRGVVFLNIQLVSGFVRRLNAV